MIPWLYKWLPIVFGCHCRADRSFHYRGKQFPICARCTGELAGMVLSFAVCWFWRPDPWLAVVLLIPMVIDGFLQLKTRYSSTNPRRFLTGILFGYGLTALLFISSLATIRLGMRLGQAIVS